MDEIIKESAPELIRVFFAIDLTTEATKSITHIMAQLQAHHKRKSIRWCQPQQLHITLQFLAAVKHEHLAALIKNVRAEIEMFLPFELELSELELFPTRYHPRIISLNMNPQEILKDLAQRIGRGILSTGYEVETRPFRGHLTLARLNRVDKQFKLAEIKFSKIEKISVKEVVLYRSELHKEGSHYTILERIGFKK